jgi:hypothetical protein
MPILFGTSASSNQQARADTGAMFPIFAATVGSAGAASITFSNIPSTYTHLQLRTFAKSNNSNANDLGGMNTQFNSDATNSYTFHFTYGTGSGSPVSSSSGATATSSIVMGFTNSNNYPASTFSLNVIDIIDYKNTNKYKTVRVLGGVDGNGAGFSWLTSGAYNKNDAISSMTITPWSGSFMQYSSFALYGIK